MPIGCGQVAIAEGWRGLSRFHGRRVGPSRFCDYRQLLVQNEERVRETVGRSGDEACTNRVDIDPQVGAFDGVGFVDDRVKTLQKSS